MITLRNCLFKKSGVRYRNPYQTRHTYASMMLTAGEHPMWVAQQMGHADWGMIRQVYGRFIPSAVNDSGDKAVALFGGSGEELNIYDFIGFFSGYLTAYSQSYSQN
jgi:integrase